ncbi:hypothetical protein [Nitrosospira multiformis]|uniref:hypothetical protein n=1 Tax=Nitrosospira multiformis TaxID=1231 RepID=UPI00089D8D01|nr:hypothetical protein [Nitrosospira multiformis]SEA75088.1 hypothetical protein SAMN05216411_1275 [Nitrosospira multiformis]
MKVIIQEPSLFFSDGDEDYFFEWLKSITSVKGFTRCVGGLEVTLVDQVDDPSLRELIGLMTRYGLDMKWLRNLRTAQNECWFANDNKYWYPSVFED